MFEVVVAVVMGMIFVGEVNTHGFSDEHKPWPCRADFISVSTNVVMEEETTSTLVLVSEAKITTTAYCDFGMESRRRPFRGCVAVVVVTKLTSTRTTFLNFFAKTVCRAARKAARSTTAVKVNVNAIFLALVVVVDRLESMVVVPMGDLLVESLLLSLVTLVEV